jgi:hypothetical protein
MLTLWCWLVRFWEAFTLLIIFKMTDVQGECLLGANWLGPGNGYSNRPSVCLCSVPGGDCFCLWYLPIDKSWRIPLTQKTMEMDFCIVFWVMRFHCFDGMQHVRTAYLFLEYEACLSKRVCTPWSLHMLFASDIWRNWIWRPKFCKLIFWSSNMHYKITF